MGAKYQKVTVHCARKVQKYLIFVKFLAQKGIIKAGLKFVRINRRVARMIHYNAYAATGAANGKDDVIYLEHLLCTPSHLCDSATILFEL